MGAETQAIYIMGIMNDVMIKALDAAYGLPTRTVETTDLDPHVPPIISTSIDFNLAFDTLQWLIANLPPRPAFDPITWTPVAMDPLDPLPEVVDVPIPDFDVPMPPVTFNPSPTWVAPGEIPGRPEVLSYAPPDRPSITLPTEPILSSITIPTPQALDMPTFDESLLDEDLIAPSNTFDFNEVQYASVLQTAVYTGLLDEIQNGGYGLNINDETLLFEREREREARAALSAVEETKKQFASLGFVLPPGALAAAVNKATQQMLDKVSSINRDLGLKRADLYWEGKKFTYQQAIQLESYLMNLHNSVQERTLNAAKAQIEVVINIFNAEVTRYKAKQERFVALAEVFKTKIQAELAKVEIYKAQMDGAKLEVEVNRSQIALYSERVGAVKTMIEIYKTDVDVFRVLSEVEKIKVDIFRSEVEAYVSEIQAKKVEFEAYESSIRGELAKVETYKAQAGAYAAIIEGKKAAVDVQRLRLTAFIERNKGLIDVFTAQVAEQKANMDAQKTYIEAQADVYKADVAAFDAEAGALSEVYKAGAQARELEYRAQLQGLTANVEIAKLWLEKVVKTAELLVETDKTRADMYKGLASSAMSAMNVHAGLSSTYSNSRSESTNIAKYPDTNKSYHTSKQDGINESKNTSAGGTDNTSTNTTTTTSTSGNVSDITTHKG
jgi:hypothetical protein